MYVQFNFKTRFFSPWHLGANKTNTKYILYPWKAVYFSAINIFFKFTFFKATNKIKYRLAFLYKSIKTTYIYMLVQYVSRSEGSEVFEE